MVQPEPPVVGATFTLELHTPETHAYPAVQAAKAVAAVGIRGGEVIRRARMTRLSFVMTRASRLWCRGVSSRTLVLNFSIYLGRIVTLQEEMAKPRKAKPSRNFVFLVFSALRVRPREVRCRWTKSNASWTWLSLWQRTTKSSA